MEKKNPKSVKLRRRDSSNSWSELPPELLISVFERLGLADLRGAESVCWSWNSAARRCVGKKQIPWLILLPNQDEFYINNHWCRLFNPEEKSGKLYKIRDEGVEFTRSLCLATNGNWLFMLDRWYNFYLWNLFTHERINLPHVESQLGTIKLERITRNHRHIRGWFSISNGYRQRNSESIRMDSAVFWIDEQTKEYVVLWVFHEWCVVYSKTGDEFWNQLLIPRISSGLSKMVYKDHKLYYLLDGSNGCIKIFDFSREIPQETFHCDCGVTLDTSLGDSWCIFDTKLVVTVTGDVLKVDKLVGRMAGLWSFRVYKVYSPTVAVECHHKVDSLGHEAMLFELGITVLANDDIVGFKRNSIYFNTICHEKLYTTQICLFNLETQEMEPLHKFDCSSHEQLERARWFLPSFKHT